MGFGSFFQKLAPWLSAGAQFIPGAGPVIAGTITKIAGEHNVALPGKVDGTVESIGNAVAALTGNADAMLALKKADEEYALQMQAAGFKQIQDMEALAVQDRESARNREIQVKDNTPKILAYLYASGFFITLAAEIWIAISGKIINPLAEKSIDLLLGVLVGMVLGTKEYYFGSSAGSEKKSDLLADIAKQP